MIERVDASAHLLVNHVQFELQCSACLRQGATKQQQHVLVTMQWLVSRHSPRAFSRRIRASKELLHFAHPNASAHSHREA